MRKLAWLSLLTLPLAVVGGLVYGKSSAQNDKPQQVSEAGYTCPMTGEQLPCPNCCPLNQKN